MFLNPVRLAGLEDSESNEVGHRFTDQAAAQKQTHHHRHATGQIHEPPRIKPAIQQEES